MKKAILIVSVGTSRVEALENTTFALQKEVIKKYEDYRCYVAFSSQHILKKMNEKVKEPYLSIEEAFECMYADGIEEVVVLPTNLLKGMESDSMLEQVEKNKERFKKVSVGRPLLNLKEDYIKTLEVILSNITLSDDEALVLIGHGSNHLSNSAYQNLEYTAYTTGHRNVFVGTIESSENATITKSHRMTLRKLSVSGYKKVCLMPLLFVAGYHARKDIAAESGSWKNVLEEAGYEVRPNLTGLGEIEGIRQIFLEHLQDAMENKE